MAACARWRLAVTTVVTILAACSSAGPPTPAWIAGGGLHPVTPPEAGFVEDFPASVERYVDGAIARRVFPGAQIVVLRGDGIVLDAVYGHETYAADAPAITADTRFDLASLTKVVATTAVAMALHGQGKLPLDATVTSILPEFAGDGREQVTLRHLLTHSAGFPPWVPFYRTVQGHDAMLAEIMRTPLDYPPGRGTRYSDLGAILLGECLTRLGGMPLDRLCSELVFRPLRMTHTSFGPLPANVPAAPTEIDPDRGGLLRGRVHDENADAYGGVAGHAGLFSTARDVARFARAVLAGGSLEGATLCPPATVELFTRRAGIVLESSRALGFDTPAPNSAAGTRLSPRSVGHTGFTGTSFWIDPERELVIVCLTNRVHPSRDNKQIHSFRRGLHDLVVESLLPAEKRG